MAFYRVFLKGTGIQVSNPVGGDSLIGFYTTRAVRAGSVEEAVERAKTLVNADWASGIYQATNAGKRPSLTVENVFPDHFFGYLMFRNKGYTFYPDSDEN